jgi:hypothetical protein
MLFVAYSIHSVGHSLFHLLISIVLLSMTNKYLCETYIFTFRKYDLHKLMYVLSEVAVGLHVIILTLMGNLLY